MLITVQFHSFRELENGLELPIKLCSGIIFVHINFMVDTKIINTESNQVKLARMYICNL